MVLGQSSSRLSLRFTSAMTSITWIGMGVLSSYLVCNSAIQSKQKKNSLKIFLKWDYLRTQNLRSSNSDMNAKTKNLYICYCRRWSYTFLYKLRLFWEHKKMLLSPLDIKYKQRHMISLSIKSVAHYPAFYMIHFHNPKEGTEWKFLCLFYRWGNWCSKKKSTLPNTQSSKLIILDN